MANLVEITTEKDDNLTEIYINGFYLCSVETSDISKEAKNLLEEN